MEPIVFEHEHYRSVSRIVDHEDRVRERFVVVLEPDGEVIDGPEFAISITFKKGSVGTITGRPKTDPQRPGRRWIEDQPIDRREHTSVGVQVTWVALVKPTPDAEPEARTFTHSDLIDLEHPVNRRSRILIDEPLVVLEGSPVVPEEELADPKRRWPLEPRPEPAEDVVELYPGRALRLTWRVYRGLSATLDRVELEGGGWKQDVTGAGRIGLADNEGHVTIWPKDHPPDPEGRYGLVVTAGKRTFRTHVAVRGVVDLVMWMRRPEGPVNVLDRVADGERDVGRPAAAIHARRGSWLTLERARQGLVKEPKKQDVQKAWLGTFPLDFPSVHLVAIVVRPQAAAGARAELVFNMQKTQARLFEEQADGSEDVLAPTHVVAGELREKGRLVGVDVLTYDITSRLQPVPDTGVAQASLAFDERHIGLGAMLLDIDLRYQADARSHDAVLRLLFERELPNLVAFDAVSASGATVDSFADWKDVRLRWKVSGDAYMTLFKVSVDGPGLSFTDPKAKERKRSVDPLAPASAAVEVGHWVPHADHPPHQGEVTFTLRILALEPLDKVLFEKSVRVRVDKAGVAGCTRCPLERVQRIRDEYLGALRKLAQVQQEQAKPLKVARFVRLAAHGFIDADVEAHEVWGSLLDKDRVKATRSSFGDEKHLLAYIEAREGLIKAAEKAADQACQALVTALKDLAFQEHLAKFHQRPINEGEARSVYGWKGGDPIREVHHHTALLTEKLGATPSGRAFLRQYLDAVHPSNTQVGGELPGFLDVWTWSLRVKNVAWPVIGKVYKNLSELFVFDFHFDVDLGSAIDGKLRSDLKKIGHFLTPSDPDALGDAVIGQVLKWKTDGMPEMLKGLHDGTLTPARFEKIVETVEAEVDKAKDGLGDAWVGATITVLSVAAAFVEIAREPPWAKKTGADQYKAYLDMASNLFSLGEALTGLRESGLRASRPDLVVQHLDEQLKVAETISGWGKAAKLMSVLGAVAGVVLEVIAVDEALKKGQEAKAAAHVASAMLGAGGILATVFGWSSFGPWGTAAGLLIAVAIWALTVPPPLEWLTLTPWGKEGKEVLPSGLAATDAYALDEVIDKYFETIFGEVKVRLVDPTSDGRQAYISLENRALRPGSRVHVSVYRQSVHGGLEQLHGGEKAIRTGDTSVGGKGQVIYSTAPRRELAILRPWEIWAHEEHSNGRIKQLGIKQDNLTEYTIAARFSPNDEPGVELTGDASDVVFPAPGQPFIDEVGRQWGEDQMRKEGRVKQRKGHTGPTDTEYLVLSPNDHELPFVVRTRHAGGCRLQLEANKPGLFGGDTVHIKAAPAAGGDPAETTIKLLLNRELRPGVNETIDIDFYVRLFNAKGEEIGKRRASWELADPIFIANAGDD